MKRIKKNGLEIIKRFVPRSSRLELDTSVVAALLVVGRIVVAAAVAAAVAVAVAAVVVAVASAAVVVSAAFAFVVVALHTVVERRIAVPPFVLGCIASAPPFAAVVTRTAAQRIAVPVTAERIALAAEWNIPSATAPSPEASA